MTALEAPPRRPSPGRIESTLRRRRAVTDRIQVAAVELLTAHGWHDVTVEGIATAAGVSARTFFRYFACKDDVVLHATRAMVRGVCDALGRRPGGEDVLEALRAAFVEVVAAAEPTALCGQVRVLAAVPPLQAQAVGEHCAGDGPLVAAVAARLGADPVRDLRPALVVATATSAVSVALARWAAAPGAVSDPVPPVVAALDEVVAGAAGLVRPTAPVAG